MSVRLKLTFSYVGLLLVAGTLLLAVVWVFLLRYVPDGTPFGPGLPGEFGPTRADLQAAFVPRAAQALVVLLVVGAGGGWLLAGRVLAPLRRITEATRAAGEGSLSHRIRLEGRDDEFRELADAFDAMLGRIEAQVGEQQRFAANASHELRTPLAITQTMLDVAGRDPHHDHDRLVVQLRDVNSRAIALTEALLLLSRADRGVVGPEPVDLALLAEDAVEAMAPLASRRGVRITTAVDPALTAGSPALLQQVATNLVHNAIVHNVPDEGSVWITTSTAPGGVALSVENTGPHLTSGLVATLVEPFQRGGSRTRTHDCGVGLGLAIVDRIVRAHDGVLTLAPRTAGGMSVTVTLQAPRLRS